VAMGTDSSGELFGNGDANWSSDVGEARIVGMVGVVRRKRIITEFDEKETISN
jgi:hypothetical protein